MKHVRAIEAARRLDLFPELTRCPACGGVLEVAFRRRRVVVGLREIWSVVSHAVRCGRPPCPLSHAAIKPEAEGALALPSHTFGLDVVAWIGTQRFERHRPLPAI